MNRVFGLQNIAVQQWEGNQKSAVLKNCPGGKNAVLKLMASRISHMLLVCFLAAVFAVAAPAKAGAAGEVCEIVGGLQYATLDEALVVVAGGQTIRLLENIDYNAGITITGKSITFDLDGHTLNVINPAAGEAGLSVNNGAVTLTGLGGPAAFNVTGTAYGVFVRGAGSSAAVTSAAASGAGGVGAWAENGGSLEVAGDAQGVTAGAGASEAGSSVTVRGHATASGDNGFGVYARIDGSVVVTGNVVASGAGGIGAQAESGGNIEVTGNAQGVMAGAYASGAGSSIIVGGHAIASGAGSFGLDALNGGYIEVGGDAQGVSYGAFSSGPGSSVAVGNNSISTGAAGIGAGAENGGSMAVTGNAQGATYGVFANNAGSSITVGGHAAASGVAGVGARAEDAGSVVVTGNVEGAHAGAFTDGAGTSIAVGGNVTSSNCGANANDEGEITIDGVITAPVYIRVGLDSKGADDYELVTTKAGYLTYTDGDSTVWVREDTAAPSIPANLRVTGRTSSSISLAWDASTDDTGVDHYLVEMRPVGGLWATVGAPAAASFNQNGLAPSTAYLFRVKAVDAAGNESPWSAELNAVTLAIGGEAGGGEDTAVLAIGTANPPDGTANAAYTHSFTASGGRPSYSFRVTLGSLPPGLSLESNGALSGTPAAAGTSRYTVTVTDSSGMTSAHEFIHIIKEGAPAANLPKTIILTIGSTAASVDGQPYTLDAAPYINAGAGRTMAPVSFISAALGAEVEWRAATRQVVIRDQDTEIVLTIDSAAVLVNGIEQRMDCPPVILPPGRTFVPLSFVVRNLGAVVSYDGDQRQITITR